MPPSVTSGACSPSTGSPATRRRCVASARRWPAPGCTSRFPACPATAPTSTTCCRRGGRTGRARSPPPTRGSRRGRAASSSSASRWAGSLALWVALRPPEVRGLVLINPVTEPQPPEVREMIGDLLAEGPTSSPGSAATSPNRARPRSPTGNAAGAADLDARRRCRAAGRPLRRADDAAAAVHVAPGPCRRSARRASTSLRTYGGDVDHRWLERSYHVATLDYDRDDIIAAAVEFASA